MQVLFLNNNSSIDLSVSVEIAKMLQCNNSLQKLYLRDNQICATGAIEIVTSLQSNYSLQCLDLSNNIIDKKCSIKIADILENNYTLTKFNLNHITIKTIGILSRNKKLLNEKRFKTTKQAII